MLYFFLVSMSDEIVLTSGEGTVLQLLQWLETEAAADAVAYEPVLGGPFVVEAYDQIEEAIERAVDIYGF